MAATITFLAAVNRVGRKTGWVIGSSDEITTFTDSARQQNVDATQDAINDVIDELYMLDDDDTFPQRGETASSTFVLASADVDYALASDFVEMEGNPIDQTNNNVLTPYPGGFFQLLEDRPDRSDFTGRPRYWVLSPEDGELEIETTPTASEVGETFTYYYRKAINLTATTDTFPFDDEIVRALYDAFAQKYKAERHKSDVSAELYQSSIARAAGMLRGAPLVSQYGTRRAAS